MLHPLCLLFAFKLLRIYSFRLRRNIAHLAHSIKYSKFIQMWYQNLSRYREIDKRCNGRIDSYLNSFIFLKRCLYSYQKTFTIAGIKYKYSNQRNQRTVTERTFGIRNVGTFAAGLMNGDGFQIIIRYLL